MRRARLFSVVSAMVFTIASLSNASDDLDPVPLKNWLLPVEQLSNLRAMPRTDSMPSRRIVANAVPSAPSTLITTVPCRIVDTRNSPGAFGGPPFAATQTRTFTIPSGPCPGIPIAAAYSLNFAIVNFDAGGGFVAAYPGGTTRPLVATVTFGKDPGFAVANAAIVPANASGAIDVYSSGNTNLIIDINGYFIEGSGGTRTVFVNGTGTDTDNGTSLLNALTGISGNSSANRFLVKLDAGVFDVGLNLVQMKPYVDMEGSGENATKILSSRTSATLDTGSVVASANSEMRALTVENTGAGGGTFGIVFFVPTGTVTNLTDARLSSFGAPWSIGIANLGGSPIVRGCTISVSNPIATQNIGVYHDGGAASINETTITASGPSAAANRAVTNQGGTPAFRRCHLSSASGGAGASPGILNQGTAGTLYIYDSIIVSTSSSIRNNTAWANLISNSQLDQPINASGGGSFICIASFSSAFAARTAGCL